MNERFIYLMEKYFDQTISNDEEQELNSLLTFNNKLRNEFEEQKNIKEVLSKMKIKNPSSEVWDRYWLGIYRRLERGVAWVAISVGAIIILGYGIIMATENFLANTTMPALLKWGIAVLALGVLVLLISLVREKLFTSKSDKYKEIQR